MSDQEFLAAIGGEAWFREAAVSRAYAAWQQSRDLMDQFAEQRRGIKRSAEVIFQSYLKLLTPAAADKAVGLKLVAEKAQELRRRLSRAHWTLLRGPLRMLLKGAAAADAIDPVLAKMSAAAARRFQDVVNKYTLGFLQRLDGLVEHCRAVINEEARHGTAK